MAEGKKTFIFYSDWINMINEMPDKDAGQLLKHILSYVNDENPDTKNTLVKMAFAHMKPMLKADLKKWEGIREKRSLAGSKGGKQKVANAKQMLQGAKQLVAVNDNVNVSTNVDDSKNFDVDQFNKLYDTFINEIKEGQHTIWADGCYIQLGLKKGSLTTLIKEFREHLKRDGKIHPNTLELRKHLNNWLNIKDSNGLLSEYKTKSKGAL